MGSRALKKKNPQDHQEERFSRGKFIMSLKRKHPQDHQEQRFSRGKFLKSLERKDPQDPQDPQEFRCMLQTFLPVWQSGLASVQKIALILDLCDSIGGHAAGGSTKARELPTYYCKIVPCNERSPCNRWIACSSY